MGTRPQTLYGLADSPVDLAAFMLDHGDGTGQPGLVTQVLDGTLQGDLTRDDLLDNITLYWLTNTGISAARLLLGEHRRLLRRQTHHHPRRHQRVPRRALPGPPQLGRTRLPHQPHPLPPSSTAAATSPPGNNPNSSPKNSGPPSKSLR